MATYLLNIGNTHSEFAELRAGELCSFSTVLTTELGTDILPDAEQIYAVSVVPHAEKRLAGAPIHFIRSAEAAQIFDLTAMDISTLGMDRIANAVAAWNLWHTPTAVLDCGTAITLELVAAPGRLIGGAIAPGRWLLRESLHLFTAQLPDVQLSETYELKPATATKPAIQLGTDCAAVGAVRQLVQLARQELGEEVKLVVTGGDAAYFARAVPELQAAPRNFTLYGAARLVAQLSR